MGTDAARSAGHAAEAIRALNHATINSDGHGPSDVYDIVAELVILSDRLPQAFGQLARILERLNYDGQVGFDSGSLFGDHSAEGVTELHAMFVRASTSATELRDALADGQQILAAAHHIAPATTAT